MNPHRLVILYLSALLVGSIAASQWVACQLNYLPALGGMHIGAQVVYPPWAVFAWARQFGSDIPGVLNEGYAFIASAFILATLILVAARRWRRSIPVREIGKDRWATRRDMKRARLLSGQGTVLGHAFGRYLTYDGPEHQLVSGASRSGKGVGHVIPTLLNWNGSVLAYDVKNELWDITAGFRSRLGYHLRSLRQLLPRAGTTGSSGTEQQTFEFTQEHPIIRDIGDYGQFVRDAINSHPPHPSLQESP